MLCDGSGEIWAASDLTPDPQWVSAAVSYRHVIVFFGPRLGVRVPPETEPASYTTAARAREFRSGRKHGLVSVATVKWQGEASGESLDWVIFLPDSSGQRVPGIFVPAPTFARQGGPAAFGLARRDVGRVLFRAAPYRAHHARHAFLGQRDADIPGDDGRLSG